MKSARTKLGLAALLLALPLLGLGCKGGSGEAQQAAAQAVRLNWWTVEANGAGATAVINQYKSLHPNASISLRYVRQDDLENTLTRALAAGQGPDIISVPNHALRAWANLLTPLPDSVTLPYLELKGFIKKEPTWTLKATPSLTLTDLKGLFVDAVLQDAVVGGKVMGLPLSLDTLMVYYNRDLLNAAGVALPPQTWTEFKSAVQAITKLDQRGHLLRNGAALGTADNVPHAADILAALMLQNGTSMVDARNTRAEFQQKVTLNGSDYAPGADALRFYTDFANPAKETYSWSADEPPAKSAFASGKLGFYLGYWRDQATLKALAPNLNFGYTGFPQIEGSLSPTYFASYYLEAVTKQSRYQDQAWDFVQFASSGTATDAYLKAARVPTARRSLLAAQQADTELAVPANQVLTARTWYRGFQPEVAEQVMLTLIRQAASGTPLLEALNFAANQLTQTLVRSRY